MKHLIVILLTFITICGFSQQKTVVTGVQPVCPVCKTHQKVIPIVYGKPAPAAVKRAEKGEIRLGGCVIGENSPRNYCKKDRVEF